MLMASGGTTWNKYKNIFLSKCLRSYFNRSIKSLITYLRYIIKQKKKEWNQNICILRNSMECSIGYTLVTGVKGVRQICVTFLLKSQWISSKFMFLNLLFYPFFYSISYILKLSSHLKDSRQYVESVKQNS